MYSSKLICDTLSDTFIHLTVYGHTMTITDVLCEYLARIIRKRRLLCEHTNRLTDRVYLGEFVLHFANEHWFEH